MISGTGLLNISASSLLNLTGISRHPTRRESNRLMGKGKPDLLLPSTELLLHITMATLHLGFPAPVEKKPKPVAALFGSR